MEKIAGIIRMSIVVVGTIVVLAFCIYFVQNEYSEMQETPPVIVKMARSTNSSHPVLKDDDVIIRKPVVYAEYFPFTPGKQAILSMKYGKDSSWGYKPYSGIKEENINYYENILSGNNRKEIVKKKPQENPTISFDQFKLEKGHYTWSVNVILKNGNIVKGEITRKIEVR